MRVRVITHWRALGLVLVAALIVGIVLGSVTPTQAATRGRAGRPNPLNVSVAHSGHAHLFPTAREYKHLRSTGALPATPAGTCPTTCHNLLGYASGPVMNTSKIYTIYWLPTGYHFEGSYDGSGQNAGDASYQNIINDFAGHLGGTAFYNTLTQYPSTSGPLTNVSTAGGSYVDTRAYPCGTTCSDTSTYGHYLTDGNIQSEVLSAITANGWPSGTGNLYLVFYGYGVQSCVQSGVCSNNYYCAYHSDFFSGGQTYLYANQFDDGPGMNCAIYTQQTPNGDAYADYTVNVASHEISEAITDPEPRSGWDDGYYYNQYGNSDEIGDLCAWVTSKMGAITLNDNSQYYVQGEWSNEAGDCVLSANLPTTLTYTGPTTVPPGLTFTAAATLADDNSIGVGKQQVTFSLNGNTCTGTTTFAIPGTPWGKASCTLTAPSTLGNYTIQASFTSANSAYQSSSQSVTFTVAQLGTTTTYTGPTSGAYQTPVTLSAHLQDANGSALAGKNIAINFGAETCTAGPTNSSGNASCAVTPSDTVSGSPYAITATFAGDVDYLQSSDTSKSFTVTKEGTTLTYTGATSADYSDSAALSGKLIDTARNSGISGQYIALGFGAESCTAGPTDSGGNASCTVTITDQAGTYPLSAQFTDANGNIASATASGSFTVHPEGATLTAKTPPTFVATGQTITLSATLRDAEGGQPLGGKTIAMQLGASGPSCSASTNATTGVATCQVIVPSQAQGPQQVTYTFTSDNYAASASTSTKTTAFTFLSGGTFVIGDMTAQRDTGTTTTAYWWGSQWYQVNRLSGREVPGMFYGFAPNLFANGKPITQLACGTTSYTNVIAGGNRAIPPTSVPTYMAVAATSTLTAGTTVNGNVVHIYIVRTNLGYRPFPSYPGTGQVVGQLC